MILLKTRPSSSLERMCRRQVLGSVDVPQLYKEVLRLLREADESGKWPSTSIGRKKIVSEKTLLEADIGGLGGSFSIGILPPPLAEPRGNAIFPGYLS